MPSGRLGAVDLAATTYTTLYTVPASKVGSFSVSFCNRNTVPARVRMALAAAAGTPGVTEFVEYDAVIAPTCTLERTGLVLDATKVVTVYSDVASVSVVAYGFEE